MSYTKRTLLPLLSDADEEADLFFDEEIENEYWHPSDKEEVFEYLEDIPLARCQFELPRPLNHPNDANKIIISTDFSDGGIYELDLNSNELTHLYKYDDSVPRPPWMHGCFINRQTKTLFVFGGFYKSLVAYPLDLDNKQMRYIEDDNALCKCETWPISCYVESRNELHVIHNSEHLVFQIHNKCIDLIKTNKLPGIDAPKLLHIPARDELIIFGSNDSKDILSLKLGNNDDVKWTINEDINLFVSPTNSTHFDVVLGFENIVFVFYFWEDVDVDGFASWDIWCYHLLNNQRFRSKFEVPDIDFGFTGNKRQSFAIKDKDDYVHIVDFISQIHIKVDLYKLIPDELRKSHCDFYEPLIMGYFREIEHDKKDIVPLPLVLKTLIVQFYPF